MKLVKCNEYIQHSRYWWSGALAEHQDISTYSIQYASICYQLFMG